MSRSNKGSAGFVSSNHIEMSRGATRLFRRGSQDFVSGGIEQGFDDLFDLRANLQQPRGVGVDGKLHYLTSNLSCNIHTHKKESPSSSARDSMSAITLNKSNASTLSSLL